MANLQLQQCEVGIAIVGLFLALVVYIVLEDCGSLWVVSVKTVKDGINVLWPIWRVIEGYAHGVCSGCGGAEERCEVIRDSVKKRILRASKAYLRQIYPHIASGTY